MKNLDVNFVLANDYDMAVSQLRALPEARIRGWMENVHLAPEQRRAMEMVLGEKELKRHQDILLWAKVAAGVSILGVLVAIVVAVC